MFSKNQIMEQFRCQGNGKKIVYQNKIYTDCTCSYLPTNIINSQLLQLLENVQKEFPEMAVTSGYRCPQHNDYSKVYCLTHFLQDYIKLDSKHCRGLAADIIIPEFGKEELEFLINTNFERISQKIFQRSLKEIFWFKLYNVDEGRDPDNGNHSEPYIHIQICDNFEKELISI